MAKKLKAGKKGINAQYITRAAALRKLQISIANFRRLCILKNVYPREPKKKLKGKNKTYYHKKDILFLLHEKLLDKFREIKVHKKKYKSAIAKKDFESAKRLALNRPVYTLHHIVKERFPTFIDALRDIDDALSSLAIFSVLSADDRLNISASTISNATQLLDEFMLYVSTERCVRKAFISIKGFYIQVEIMSELILIHIPHAFSQNIPKDVDFRVLMTFLELHTTMIKFVNFKLYASSCFVYPPKFNKTLKDEGGRFLAYEIESLNEQIKPLNPKCEADENEFKSNNDEQEELGETEFAKEKNAVNSESKIEKQKKKDEKRKSEEVLTKEKNDIKEEENKKKKVAEKEEKSNERNCSSVNQDNHKNKKKSLGCFDDDETVKQLMKQSKEVKIKQHLFDGLVFYVSCEVPLVPVSLIIQSCGGKVLWFCSDPSYSENSQKITHQIVDRPENLINKSLHAPREYIQPQWIFDSLNIGMKLPVYLYSPSKTLPPHLSPFVDDKAVGYIPKQRQIFDRMINETAINENASEKHFKDDIDNRCSESEEESSDALPKNLSTLAMKPLNSMNNSEVKSESNICEDEAKLIKKQENEKEERERRKMMLSKKHKRLYDRIEFGKERKKQMAQKLLMKRKRIETSATTATYKKKL